MEPPINPLLKPIPPGLKGFPFQSKLVNLWEHVNLELYQFDFILSHYLVVHELFKSKVLQKEHVHSVKVFNHYFFVFKLFVTKQLCLEEPFKALQFVS